LQRKQWMAENARLTTASSAGPRSRALPRVIACPTMVAGGHCAASLLVGARQPSSTTLTRKLGSQMFSHDHRKGDRAIRRDHAALVVTGKFQYVWFADLVRLTVFTALVDNAELWEWIIRTGAVPAWRGSGRAKTVMSRRCSSIPMFAALAKLRHIQKVVQAVLRSPVQALH
jgi:hypothetical protein